LTLRRYRKLPGKGKGRRGYLMKPKTAHAVLLDTPVNLAGSLLG